MSSQNTMSPLDFRDDCRNGGEVIESGSEHTIFEST